MCCRILLQQGWKNIHEFYHLLTLWVCLNWKAGHGEAMYIVNVLIEMIYFVPKATLFKSIFRCFSWYFAISRVCDYSRHVHHKQNTASKCIIFVAFSFHYCSNELYIFTNYILTCDLNLQSKTDQLALTVIYLTAEIFPSSEIFPFGYWTSYPNPIVCLELMWGWLITLYPLCKVWNICWWNLWNTGNGNSIVPPLSHLLLVLQSVTSGYMWVCFRDLFVI